MRTDDAIHADALKHLEWSPDVPAAEIGVTVRAGVVTLMGWVEDLAQKTAAEAAVAHIPGVAAVVNDIEVGLPEKTSGIDTEIAEAVREALKGDPLVCDGALSATVSDAWVTITGQVDTHAAREAAEHACRGAAGVYGVTNLVHVVARSETESQRTTAAGG